MHVQQTLGFRVLAGNLTIITMCPGMGKRSSHFEQTVNNDSPWVCAPQFQKSHVVCKTHLTPRD